MEKKSIKSQEVFVSEEERTLVWEDVQSAFEKNFGTEVYSSWLKNISLLKEYNDYLVLGVPTRFFRDWIVSRYLDKILSQLKTFKNSINRVEFKISEENKITSVDAFKIDDFNKVTEIKDSILNYNRLNPNLNFDNFVSGSSNEIALSSSKKVCEQISRYNPLYIYGGVGLGKTHLLNAIGLELEKKPMLCLFLQRDLCIILSNQLKKMIWLTLKISLENHQFSLLMIFNLSEAKKAYRRSFFIHLTV